MENAEKSIPCMADQVISLTVQLSDCDLSKFINIAANFGSDSYAYAVTPNVDHLIRFCDDPSFRELYQTAGFVLLDSRFLS